MRIGNLVLGVCLWTRVILIGPAGLAQPQPVTAPWTYILLKGSQLTDECPICDRAPIVVPMSGTFELQVVNSNPLFTVYAVTNISFQAGSTSGPQYQVVGGGTYQLGGEVALVQELSLSTQINDGLTNRWCFFTNAVDAVSNVWPQIAVNVDQTNGNFLQVYHLQLVAVPALQFVTSAPDSRSGDLQFEWVGNTSAVQLERATNAAGPYSVIVSNLTAQSFVDAGALTNGTRLYYRLRE